MAGELLSIGFEMINLSKLNASVLLMVKNIKPNQKELIKLVEEMVDELPQELDFLSNLSEIQPLGTEEIGINQVILTEERLKEIASELKKVAIEKKSKEFISKANGILQVLEIVNDYIKNKKLFSLKVDSDLKNPISRI